MWKEADIRQWKVDMVRHFLGAFVAPGQWMVVRCVSMMVVASMVVAMVVMDVGRTRWVRHHGKRQADRTSGAEGESALDDQKERSEDS